MGRARRRDAIALLGASVLVAAPGWIIWEILSSGDPLAEATLYGAYLGPVALVVPLLVVLVQWWWKGHRAQAAAASAAQVLAAADQLAVSMFESWRTEATERRISVPAPVRVRWQWASTDVTPPPAQVLTIAAVGTGPRPLPEPNPDQPNPDQPNPDQPNPDQPNPDQPNPDQPNPDQPNPDQPAVLLDAGVVTRLHDEAYRRLPHGRLVLLGRRGAGKTGAMILLLLAALEHRHRVPEARRGQVPVPVWLTLGGWDPTTQTLHQWATATMYRDHPYLRAPGYGPDTAGELLRTGRVALFLDGLDEMAPTNQHQALTRIDQEGSGLRIVLSSRPDGYRNAITRGRMHNTAVIEVQPVDPDEAGTYLRHDQIGLQRDRWARIGDYLIQQPDSVATQALDNPLTLSLARATYQDQDPAPLINPARFPTAVALREHLIDRILITAYPDEHQRAHATRWLAWIAHHLGDNPNLAWWHIPTWIPRWRLRLAVGLAFGLAFGLASGLMIGLTFGIGLGLGLAGGLTAGLAFGLMIGLAFGFAGGLTVGITNQVGRQSRAAIPRRPRLRKLIQPLAAGLAGGLTFGLPGGFAVGLTGSLTDGFAYGLAAGLAGGIGFGLAAGFVRGIGDEPQAVIPRRPRPRELIRPVAFGLTFGPAGVLTYGASLGLTFGPALGLAFGLAVGFTLGFTIGLLELWRVPLLRAASATPATTYRVDRRTSTVIGLAGGFAGGLVGGPAVPLAIVPAVELAVGAARMVRLTQLILMSTGAGRVNFMTLLEEAHQRQVLRQAGTVYQFRHAELQEHLANVHRQGDRPR